MGWDRPSRERWAPEYGGDDFRHGHTRSRSRSSSRDRHRRRRSRSSSRGRHPNSSPDHGYTRGRSRSPDRGWSRRSRGSNPHGHCRSVSPPSHQQPPWHAGPGADSLPPWQQHPGAPGPQQWQQPGAVAPPAELVQAGCHEFVSRWDTGSRWDSARSRSRGPDSYRDRELDERGLRAAMGPGPGPEVPTASVFIKGLPADVDESDVHAAFAGFPNIQSVKVLRDRATGRSKGTAFLDFLSVDDARMLMESEARDNMVIGGQQLFLDYSSGPPVGSSGQGPAGPAGLDWICEMCSAVNFSRRLECYHCSTARPANPKRVTGDHTEPSNILKVSGLEAHTSEEALYQVLSSVGQHILDMRVIKDKFTGAPRGFAFVELPTVAAAGTVMVACQGVVLPGQLTPLKICYGKAKDSMLGSAAPGDAPAGPGPAAGAGAVAAAASVYAPDPRAAAGPLGWKPKEFNPDGSVKDEQQQPADQPAAAGSAGPEPGSEAAAISAAAAAAAGVDAGTIQAMTQAGFQYQACSGYWWDPKSGYFYDAATQLYYHHSTSQWYQYSADTGQYTAVGGEQQQQQQHGQGQGQQQRGAAQGQQQQQKPAAAADKRRRAVIGSAPQYNPEGVLAAAALAQERAAEERRAAAAKAARERQQEQQNKHGSKQQQPKLMQGKPGIGMLPGTGAAPAPAAVPVAPRLAQIVDQGNLQGVVYRSKWSQQRAQQKSG